jgi:hypothetical protein
MKKKGAVKFKHPHFLNKTAEYKVHVDETAVPSGAVHDIIIIT